MILTSVQIIFTCLTSDKYKTHSRRNVAWKPYVILFIYNFFFAAKVFDLEQAILKQVDPLS